MKKKHLIFCLLFLFLGTTIAWADKYYKPEEYKNAGCRLTLERAVGAKFMIYNTAIDGNNYDRTGFLRNGGVQFHHVKCKERDNYLYNESFVYTMEAFDDNADGTPDWYAIKSVLTGLYVNFEGKTDIGDPRNAKLYISSWNDATEGKSGVNMEGREYNIVANGSITGAHGNTVFVVKGETEEVKKYWNGTVDNFDHWSDAHPYAFYLANEYTNDGDRDFLTDLHIYSRCDIYSAQVIYGYVQDPSKITTNFTYNDEGGTANLLDGDATTYNVTNRTANTGGDYHYYQVELGASVSSLYLYMQRRADGNNAPTKYELQGCIAGETYETIGEYTTNLASEAIYASPLIKFPNDKSYEKIRIVAKERSNTNYMCMGLSELYVLPGTKEVEDAIAFSDAANDAECPMYLKASEAVYQNMIDEFNATFPNAKLLSGVPVPGGKYRIYADDYDIITGLYVNQELKASGEDIAIMEQGAYHKASDADKKYFEWYCEQTADGFLVFRNVADTEKYLGFGEVVDQPYKWSFNTSGTQRFGVPLKNGAQQYLAIGKNYVNLQTQNPETGDCFWQGDLKEFQNPQNLIKKNVVDDKGNDDEVTYTTYSGFCTDFVFIPVPLDAENEKRVTITGNDLVQRNTTLMFGGKQYPLPFSQMIIKGGTLPTMQLLCSELHSYAGVKVNGGEVGKTGEVAYNEETKELSFNFDEIDNGDLLDIHLEIKPPFEITQPDASQTGLTKNTALYLIRSKRPQGIVQQSLQYQPLLIGDGLDIDDSNIGVGGDGDDPDAPVSSHTSQYYYAKFANRAQPMQLVANGTDGAIVWENFDASSLFYFTAIEGADNSLSYSVKIHNATTSMLCAATNEWNQFGITWHVQPKVTSSYTAYNIGKTSLNATNNPKDAWCTNHDDGDKILPYYPDDDGSAWEFVKVVPENAKVLLKNFIDAEATEIIERIKDYFVDNDSVNELKDEYKVLGYGADKLRSYLSITTQLKDLAGGYYDATNIEKLVQFAQNIHMIEHEIEYALLALPLLSDEGKINAGEDFTHPIWYYIKNKNTGDYAAYSGDETPMTLAQGDKTMSNMFYLVGEKNTYGQKGYEDHPGNNLIIDEYIKVHLHNSAAGEKTLFSKNTNVDIGTIDTTPNVKDQPFTIADSAQLAGKLNGDEDWCIEMEYNIDLGAIPFNAWGSCLLVSGNNPLANSYGGDFQIYLQDDHDLVVKLHNADDTRSFKHIKDHYTYIKIVLTYIHSTKTFTVDVWNSALVCETMTIKLNNNQEMNDITKLSAALPMNGFTLKTLEVSAVEAMKWKDHVEDGASDLWYIFPSSNTVKPGLTIVLDEPNDKNMAWAQSAGVVANNLGTNNESTWVFERVTDFNAHRDSLLASVSLDGYEDCVIYNKELAKLLAIVERCSTTIKNNTGEVAEAAFNELYSAVTAYKKSGVVSPEDLKAPKPGSLYTIRPDADCEQGLQVHIASNTTDYSTKELYNGAYLRANGVDCDPRAAWVFEATDGGYKVKNLHTRCYIGTLGAEKTMVDEGATATVALAPLGGLTTSFKVGEQYASMPNKLVYTNNQGRDDFTFWGTVVTSDTYPAEVGTALGTATELTNATVYCKSTDVFVDALGSVSVTFTHNGGSHKLNILGATLLDKYGKTVGSEYRHGTAGGNPSTQTYTIADVAPGAYTLNCYFGHSTNGGNELDYAGGSMVIAGVSSIDGLTKVINTGDDATKWIVEEIKNPEKTVYHEAPVTASHKHGTMMLGFPATIPAGVEAYRPCGYGIASDIRYVSMEKYTTTVPAGKAVILKRTVDDATSFKFCYSATPSNETIEGERDDLLFGSLYNTLIDCDSLRGGQEVNTPGANHVFMLQANKGEARLFRIWENRNDQGVKPQGNSNNDDGGHILNNANKAYFVLPFNYTPATETQSFSLRYDGYLGGTTAIEGVEQEDAVTATGIESVYDLQGRKLTEITEPGIYIVNGKKIVVK